MELDGCCGRLEGVAGFVVNRRFHRALLPGRQLIHHVGPDPDLRLRHRHLGCGHGGSPVFDMDHIRRDEPHVAVNAGPGIEMRTAARLVVNKHRQHVVARGIQVRRQIAIEADISESLAADLGAVQEDL